MLAIAKLLSFTGGSINYAVNLRVGFASQRDILWSELTCYQVSTSSNFAIDYFQHVRLWRVIKSSGAESLTSDTEILERCDLEPKMGTLSQHLSGGQKRKLALASALAGGSNLLLLDEITSGLDPLSRRAIWNLVSSNRGQATILLTTHCEFLTNNLANRRSPR